MSTTDHYSFKAYCEEQGISVGFENVLRYFEQARPARAGLLLENFTAMLDHVLTADRELLQMTGPTEYEAEQGRFRQLDRVGARRVIVISNSLSREMVLYRAIHPTVGAVMYDAASCSLEELEQRIVRMCQQPVDSIAFIDHGHPGAFHLLHSVEITTDSLSQPNVHSFFKRVGDCLRPDGRVDLLACNLTASPAGRALVTALERVTGKKVAASNNLTGVGGDFLLETGRVDAACAYFDLFRLQLWQSNAGATADAGWQLVKWVLGPKWVDMGKFALNVFNGIFPAASDQTMKKILDGVQQINSKLDNLTDQIAIRFKEAQQQENYSFIIGEASNTGHLSDGTFVMLESKVNSFYSCLLGGDINDSNAPLDENCLINTVERELRRERLTCDRFYTRMMAYVCKLTFVASTVTQIFAGTQRTMAMKQSAASIMRVQRWVTQNGLNDHNSPVLMFAFGGQDSPGGSVDVWMNGVFQNKNISVNGALYHQVDGSLGPVPVHQKTVDCGQILTWNGPRYPLILRNQTNGATISFQVTYAGAAGNLTRRQNHAGIWSSRRKDYLQFGEGGTQWEARVTKCNDQFFITQYGSPKACWILKDEQDGNYSVQSDNPPVYVQDDTDYTNPDKDIPAECLFKLFKR